MKIAFSKLKIGEQFYATHHGTCSGLFKKTGHDEALKIDEQYQSRFEFLPFSLVEPKEQQ